MRKHSKPFSKTFSFVGRGPDSKSLLNRAWVVQSYFPELQIEGDSLCEDIQIIKKAVCAFKKKEDIYCGSSASALRFMALRVSRSPGEFVLKGETRLFSRPHQPLIHVLSQLGVSAQLADSTLTIKSRGWQPQGDALIVPAADSSQFASAVFLNSFQLEQGLFVSLEGSPVSVPYLEMTLLFLSRLGFQIQGSGLEFYIPPNGKILKNKTSIEPDMSSLFALACLASLRGQMVITPWPKKSLQPDFIFPSLLEEMGVCIERKGSSLKITPSRQGLKGLSVSLNSCPDLFPCLSVLCALAEGRSVLNRSPHLKFKESNRIQKTAELIQEMGRSVELKEDGLVIHGLKNKVSKKSFSLDPDLDHRIAMAGGVAAYAGFPVDIQNKSVVNKSFPEFWKYFD